MQCARKNKYVSKYKSLFLSLLTTDSVSKIMCGGVSNI